MKAIVKVFHSVALVFLVGIFFSPLVFYFYATGSMLKVLLKPTAFSAQNNISISISATSQQNLKPEIFNVEPFGRSNGLASVRLGLAVSPLNGSKTYETRVRMPVIAVMVENLRPARPQSGLSGADVVYEAMVEGGITRFLALFHSQEADVVGPVRSARAYFAEIAHEYDAWYAHVGGSNTAFQFIAKYKLHNLDQFWKDKAYWRDSQRMKRGLEHSMYVDTNILRTFINGSLPDTFKPWKFKNEEAATPEESSQKQNIEINFSKPAFKVRWEYNPVSKLYLRYLGNIPHIDAQNGETLSVKNVLVQYVKTGPVLNAEDRNKGVLNIELTGKGKGMLFRDGKAFPLVWEKQKSGQRTIYFDENDEEIVFSPGVIWIELVTDKSQVNVEM